MTRAVCAFTKNIQGHQLEPCIDMKPIVNQNLKQIIYKYVTDSKLEVFIMTTFKVIRSLFVLSRIIRAMYETYC